ncbi:hypothetical protein [Salinarchaeum laminariae]|uniref:hypothetical protein n=1 Tax=Salinarchaeum laminariae TaxID=869888 RepID=UPI0020BF823D|nr:hypothetical protein [Salinarchaeum laminariae]
MNWNSGGDDRATRDRERDTGREWSNPDDSEFTTLKAETKELDYEGLLDDPEYVDFLEAFGELEMPSDGGVDITELLEIDEHGVEDGADDEEAGAAIDEAVDASAELSLGEIPDEVANGGRSDSGESGSNVDETVDAAGEKAGDAPDDDATGETPAGDTSEEATAVATDDLEHDDTDDGDEAHSPPVDDFIAAVSAEDVTDEKRAEIRRALGVGPPKRVEVQLNHLKSRFLDLEAYIQAMEDILDAEADPLGDIETLEEDVESLRQELNTVTEQLDSLESSVESIEAAQTEDVERVEASIQELRSSVEHDVSALAQNLRSLLTWRERLGKAMQHDESRDATRSTAIKHGTTDDDPDAATDQMFEFPEQ